MCFKRVIHLIDLSGNYDSWIRTRAIDSHLKIATSVMIYIPMLCSG